MTISHRPISALALTTDLPPRRSGKAGGKTGAEMREWETKLRDAQLVTERCGSCGEWEATGPACDVRRQFAAHLAVAHPEVRVARRRRHRRIWERGVG